MKQIHLETVAPATPSKASIHDGHRGRLREQFRQSGLESFAPHQIIELLLTYPIRRKDVNEEAHALIDRFGSVSGVLDASYEDLCTVRGIAEESATFFKLLSELSRLYAIEECSTEDAMDTAEKITTYLHALYVGVTCEKVYLLLFDNGMHLLDCSCVGEGSVNSVTPDMRAIAELAVTKHAACAVLAHNHPGGLAIPSGEDRVMTDQVACLLDTLKIPLLEHFLMTKTVCTGLLRRSRGLLRATPFSEEADEGYWRHFYGEKGV